MKILVVSDTHRHDENLLKVLHQVGPIDGLFHLGDAEGSEDYIHQIANCPVSMVCGNNDFFSDLKREEVLTIGPFKIFLTHGHYYCVGAGTTRLKKEAKIKGCNIAMFGHTHKPLIEYDEEITVINPGSLSYPRQEGRRPSYILMEIDNRFEAHYTIHYL
ncbi:MAG TPA: metallophosphoesterase [Candidatus Merdenecus merdavium]|nr:metallophosphoesterase [Candidatus Merdenecus merdavium]